MRSTPIDHHSQPASPPAEPARRSLPIYMLPALLVVLCSSGVAGFTPDSAFYWSAARSLRQVPITAALSPTTGVAYDEARQRFGEPSSGPPRPAPPPPAPLCAWPPGYPIALAAIASLTQLPLSRAAVALNALCLLALCALGARLIAAAAPHLSGRRAAIAALLLCIQPAFQGVGRRLWSEPLFLVLIAAGLLALHRALRPILLATLLAAAASYLRFTGFTLALAAALHASRRAHAAAALAGYGLLVAPLLLSQRLRCGTAAGVARLPSDRTFLENLRDLARALYQAIPLCRGAVPGWQDVALSAVALALLCLLLLRRARSAPAPLPSPAPLLSFALIYTAALLLLRTRSLFDPLSVRLLAPALFAAGVYLAAAVAPHLTRPLAALALAIPLAASLADGLRNAPGWQPRPAPCPLPSTAAPLYSDQPLELHLQTGRPVSWPPPDPAQAPPGSLLVLAPDPGPYFHDPARAARYQAAWPGPTLRCRAVLAPLSEDAAAWPPPQPSPAPPAPSPLLQDKGAAPAPAGTPLPPGPSSPAINTGPPAPSALAPSPW